MMRNIHELFKYESLNTPLHHIDPRSKLATIFIYLVLTIILSDIMHLLIILIIILSQLAIGRALRKFAKGLLTLTPFLVLILILNYLSLGSVSASLVPVFRFLLFLAIMDLFFLTTDPDDFALTLESLRLPLTVSLSFSLALRFIPTMAEQVNEIVEAQLSRGLKLDQGNFFARIRKYVPILIPIIILSIKRSIEVAESLEIRGVDPNIKRIHYVALKLSMRDIVYFLVNLGLVIVVYLASSYISSESLIALLHFSKI